MLTTFIGISEAGATSVWDNSSSNAVEGSEAFWSEHFGIAFLQHQGRIGLQLHDQDGLILQKRIDIAKYHRTQG